MNLIKISLLIFALLPSVISKAQQQKEKVMIFLHEGVEILDFAGPMEVFIQAGFDVYTVGLTKEPIVAMRHLKVIPDYSLDDYPAPDIITFYGGGGAATKSKDINYMVPLREVVEKTAIRFSVCSGAFFLAETGVLDGHKATTFHSMTGMLQEGYPKIEVLEKTRFVDNGDVITTAGISAGIDGALHLVAKLRGLATAQSVATNMEYDKWIPGEGLIIEQPIIGAAKEVGLKQALKEYPKAKLYKNDLINLVKYYSEKKDWDQAMFSQEYLVKSSYATVTDYQALGELYQKNGKKAPITEESFLALVTEGKLNEAQTVIESTRKAHPDWLIYRNYKLVRMGYEHLWANELDQALPIFKLHTVGYPNDWNAWDSLAECYMKKGQADLAIKYYQKSLVLNPKNSNADKMLEKIRKEMN